MRWGAVPKRWDPNYCHTIGVFLEKIDSSHVSVHKLKRFIEYIQYGISERATSEIVGIPMLRMLNLQDSDWDIRDLKYIDLSEKDKNNYLVNKKDILFNRTNSKELVGKCAVFDLPGEYVFASYLIRVRVRSSYLIPEYLVIFLESSLGRMQIDAVSRQIAGMTNINAEEIGDFLIPIPSLHLQSKIVETWNQALILRKSLVSQAQDLLASIDDYLLDALGIRLPPEPENTIGNRIFRAKRRELAGWRFDPHALHPERESCIEELTHTLETRKLREIVKLRRNLVNEIPENLIYIGLENIESNTGRYLASSEKDSVSSAFIFNKGQVLFPKLRPYLNKVFLAPFDGVCSTEFHIFDSPFLDNEFLVVLQIVVNPHAVATDRDLL